MNDEPIHTFFGLSYANYMVLPRLILQSMPEEWQEKFVSMLNEMFEAFGTDFEPKGGYRVQALDENKRYYSDPYSDYRRGRRRLKAKEQSHEAKSE
jgi:hypothetical protein